MANAVEDKLKTCKKCNKQTIHQRNTTKTTFVMALIHLALILVTYGVWLVLLIIWKVINKPIGGWICSECGTSSKTRWYLLVLPLLLLIVALPVIFGFFLGGHTPFNLDMLTKERPTTAQISEADKTKQKAEAKLNAKVEAVKKEIVKRFQGDSEPWAKDAVWTSDFFFKVGAFDDGTLQDGHANYVCEVLYEYGFKGANVTVQIIDIIELTQHNKWKKIGEARCL